MLQHQATNGWRERQRGGSAFVLRWLRRFGGRGRGRGSSGGCRRRSSTGLLLRRRAATFLDIGQESPYFYRVTLRNHQIAHDARHRRRHIHGHLVEIGRASCRERVDQYVQISVVASSLKIKNRVQIERSPIY